ncbi:MAG: GAF domain-containing protein [Anaerolineales bacterium]|nr:GAF domain-containing protein [Anaerolineales bacterium]
MNNQLSSPSTLSGEWRAGFLRTTLILACVFGLIALIAAFYSSAPIYFILYCIVYTIVILITVLPASYNVRAITLVSLLIGLSISGLTETGLVGEARIFMLTAIAMASMLFSWRIGQYLTVLAMIIYTFFGWLTLSGNLVISNSTISSGTLVEWITRSLVLLLVAVLVVNAIRLTQSEFIKSENRSQVFLSDLQKERDLQEDRIQERTQLLDKRTSQLRAVADVGKSITSYRNLSELLQQTTRLINQNFGFYHVGIFLLDERQQFAILTAANSEGGLRMLEKGHQLKVGETGIVGYVAETIKARIALDVGEDAVFFNNPDLPNTRSEMALPLVVGGQILGVLDVQSTEPNAFADEDVSTLQILAEQLAVAIQNATLFSETEKALEASRLAYGEISREAWIKILRNQQARIGFIATPPGISRTQSDQIEPSLAKAVDTGDLILDSDGLTISVPIKIRGQAIGAIRLKKSEISEAWTQDETGLAVTLSDQLSSALESARLYQDSQQRAARESLVSDISARLSAVTQMDLIIRETVQELGEAIGNASITFQLLDQPNGHTQMPDRENGRGKAEI